MKLVTLTKSYQVEVDDEDYERINKIKWYAQVSKRYVYAAHRSKDGLIYLHRFILNCPYGFFVDHIDHNTLNCQKSNLRLCSNRQNQWNGKMPAKKGEHPSQFKGVCWERGKWRARIRVNGQKKHLGSFSDEWQAAQAYNQASISLHKDFACLNQTPNCFVEDSQKNDSTIVQKFYILWHDTNRRTSCARNDDS